MVGFIYIIRNTLNSKVYIGQTRTSIKQRWAEHLRHSKHGIYPINKAMKKYGVDKFYIETLEICPVEKLDEREIFYIALYESYNKSKGYNVSLGGRTPKFERKELSVSELVNLYVNEQLPLERIAEMYGVTRYIISTELLNAGIKLRDRHVSATRFSKLKKEDLEKALKQGSLRKGAKYLNVPYPTFRKACRYYGIEYNSSKSARHSDIE